MEKETVTFLERLWAAYYISEIPYSMWDIFKTSSMAFERKKALKAKARAMVVFDRVQGSYPPL